MGLFSQLLGLVLLSAGIGLGVWGAPYYMLDWGGVLVITGAILASCGLIVLLMGTLLRRLSALSADVSALRSATLAPTGFDPRTADAELAMAAPAVGPDREDGQLEFDIVQDRKAASALSATAQDRPAHDRGSIAVPAIAAAGGLAVAAQSIFSAVTPSASARSEGDEYRAGRRVDPSFEPLVAPPDEAEAAASVYGTAASASPVHGMTLDDFSAEGEAGRHVPDDEAAGSARLSPTDREALDRLLAQLDVEAAAPSQPPETQQELESDAEPEWQGVAEPAIPVPSVEEDEYIARIDRAARSLKALPAADDIGPIEEAAPAFPDPTPVRVPVVEDEFADLRADLEGQLDQAPPHQAARMDEIDAGTVSAEAGRHEADQHHEAGTAWFGNDRDDPPTTTSMPAIDGPASAEEDEAMENAVLHDVAAQAPQPEQGPFAPLASDEGVVAAYTVGDSAYAMLADGRIRVTTPDSQHLFQSMDELKQFMAQRRSAI